VTKIPVEKVYDAICRSLQEFGCPSVTPQMIREIHARQKYHEGMLKILRAMGASPPVTANCA
jgi:hypothetical protein